MPSKKTSFKNISSQDLQRTRTSTKTVNSFHTYPR
jgi:hypothetical protein